MIELLATAESFEQAKHLIDCGVDTIYMGEETYGLRLPYSFSREEQRAVIAYAHAHGREVNVAVNAILHNDQIKTVPSYLTFLKENGVDRISVGDTGLIQLLKQPDYYIPFIYDAETIVTNHRQVDFWANYGAVGAVAAREVPFEELQKMAKATLPIEVLVYGATCIHQSKRKLMRNYFNFIEKREDVSRQRDLFLSEPKGDDTHYSIYEDGSGTHIFANNDLNLLPYLGQLAASELTTWKLDGLYCPGRSFVSIAKLFVEAREAIKAGLWSEALGAQLDRALRRFHPAKRGLDTGFFLLKPDQVK